MTSCSGRSTGASSLPTDLSIWGLMPSTMMSAACAASVFDATVRMPSARARCSRRSARGWLATMRSGAIWPLSSSPESIDSAITPVPTVAIVTSLSDMRPSIRAHVGVRR